MTLRSEPATRSLTSHRRAHVPALHVVTDTRDGRDPLPDVRAVLATGPCAIQVRSKELSDRAMLELTRRVLDLAHPVGALVLVDDRVDVALAAGADGAHLGATDLPVSHVRAVVPADFVIGATVRSAEQARLAQEAGATYLGTGPAYATTTKEGLPEPLGPTGVAAVAAATSLPVIAIGGVTAGRVAVLRAAGAHGIAVVAALSQAPDPVAAAAALAAALSAPLSAHPPTRPPAPPAPVVITRTTPAPQ